MNTGRNKKSVHRLVAIAALAIMLMSSGLLSGCALFEGSTASEDAVSSIEPAFVGEGEHGGYVSEEYGLSAEDQGVRSGSIAPAPGGSGIDAMDIPAEDRLIIRNVDMRVRVDSVEEAVDSIRASTETHKGTVVNMTVSSEDEGPVYREGGSSLDYVALSGYITVRIPAASLDAFLAEIADLGTVLREAENSSDVTQEHVDLKARLGNLQATEAQLREFLSQAKNVTEMLAVEQELSRIRGDIEAMQAQIAWLERQAAHSTVTIELTGPKPVVRPAGEDWGFVASLTQAVRAFVGTINGIIVVAGALGPIIIIGLVVWLLVRSMMRRRRSKAPSVPDENPAPQTPEV